MDHTFHIKKVGPRQLCLLVDRGAEHRIQTGKSFDTIYKLWPELAVLLQLDTSPESLMVERDAEVTTLGSTVTNVRGRFPGRLDDDGVGVLLRGVITTTLIGERSNGQGRANLAGRPCKRGH